MSLSDNERKTLLKTRLRNLKRKYAKMQDNPNLVEECIELKAEIDGLKRELNHLQWWKKHHTPFFNGKL